MPDHSFFNPNLTAASDNKIFGLPFEEDSARLVLMPVPWEVTTSYGRGTAQGPKAILKASPQLDLYNPEHGNHYEKGYFLQPELSEIKSLNKTTSLIAMNLIEQLESGGTNSPSLQDGVKKVNEASRRLNELVYENTKALIEKGKKVGLLGGDHSTPYGFIKALSENYSEEGYGLLHIDAHHDLRVAYQGFSHSHASIMHNVLELPNSPKSLVQVGIRDFCEDEAIYAKQDSRVHCFYDSHLAEQKFNGNNWSDLCKKILDPLPEKVYISFDIDGLSPEFCPHTGTPVPGGLSFTESLFLIKDLVKSGRTIVGFDLSEVSPAPDGQNEWDGNVGARVLFQLCNWMMESHV